MNKNFYLKLALNSIKKNKKHYYPYIMAGSLMVMIVYIFSFLSNSKVVLNLPGKEVLPVLFDFGSKCISVFSIPFLFYTNSALIKKRKKELGLYNILGMNKKNLSIVMFFETVFIYITVIFFGLLLGIVFSKLAELGLVNIMAKDVNYSLYIDIKSFIYCIVVFAFIYILILINSVRLIIKNNPIELLHSEMTGEKQPKSSKKLSFLSIIALVVSYIIIFGLSMPIDIKKLSISLILLMLGTFGVFVSLSVYICNRLKENKKFYYKISNFISVSSMRYRMKRNGVSLAIIAILVTFILSSLAFSISFYRGSINTIDSHYPYDIGISAKIPTNEIKKEVKYKVYKNKIKENVKESISKENIIENTGIYSANMLGVIDKKILDLGYDMKKTWFIPGYYDGWERGDKKIVYIRIISVDDYNEISGKNESLKDSEVIFLSEKVKYKSDIIKLYDKKEVKIKEKSEKMPKMAEVRIDGASLDSHGCDEVVLVVKNLYDFMGKEKGLIYYKNANYMSFDYQQNINLKASDIQKKSIYNKIRVNEKNQNSYFKIEKAEKFYALSGGLLFLAVIMNILFVSVTALIMYYKQISEGYEDQKRFNIMKNLGMTKKQIKKSINSQMMIVFLLPIIISGIHFIFCSNIIYILLKYAVVDNKILVYKVMLVCYLIFTLSYLLVYKLTSGAYFEIVNTKVKN